MTIMTMKRMFTLLKFERKEEREKYIIASLLVAYYGRSARKVDERTS